ncbi:MAG: OsmC family protein [Candidatus Neomarinimicrobiota bacterium]|jgi:uncharacterized OsmC-like protein
MPKMTSKVTAYSENPTKTIVQARDFKIVIDEPENFGGTNHGPNPVEYVLSALAGCLNVVGHIVAQEMGFEVRGIKIDLEGDLDPSKFMGQDTDKRAGFEAIKVTLKPDCDADEATLAKWLDAIESRCPVSDNLSNATPVEIKVV